MTATNGVIPEALKGTGAKAVEPQDPTDWKQEAEFWQLKYFEQLNHSTQVITALSRPMLSSVAAKRLAAKASK